MAAKPLTAAEKAWIKKLQTVLNACPSDRFEAYTIGDNNITLIDAELSKGFDRNLDVCVAANETEATLAVIYTPFPVLSTAG